LQTPLSIAIEKQNENMAQLLRMYGGQLTETIQLEVIQLQKKTDVQKQSHVATIYQLTAHRLFAFAEQYSNTYSIYNLLEVSRL